MGSVSLCLLLVCARSALAAPLWAVNAADFPDNMSVTAVVMQGAVYKTSGTLVAFMDGQVRGVQAAPKLSPVPGAYQGQHVWMMMIYGDPAESGVKRLTFQLYDPLTDQTVNLQPSVPDVKYQENDALGSALQPLILTFNSEAAATGNTAPLPAPSPGTLTSASPPAGTTLEDGGGGRGIYMVIGLLLAVFCLWKGRQRFSQPRRRAGKETWMPMPPI